MSAGTLMHPGRVPGRARPRPGRRAYVIFPVFAPPGCGSARLSRMPGRHPGRFQQRLRRNAYLVTPPPLPVIPPGSGVVGASTFVLSLQTGTKLTYGWQTSVIASYAGKEQRESTVGPPRRHFSGPAFLLDAGMREVTGQLQRSASRGATFLLALPMEALTLAADSLGVVVAVGDATSCDWLALNQRCVVVGIDGSSASAIVVSSTFTTVTIALTNADGSVNTAGVLGATGRAGARIMPLLQVLLAPQQGFTRYAVNVGLWALDATASVFGFAGVDSMGVGASITTISAGAPVPVAQIQDNDLMIWDRTNEISGTTNESMRSRTELVELGGVPFSIGAAEVPDWQRTIQIRSTSREDWQWFKAFIRVLRGQQKPFLLSTNRPDLVYVSTVSGSINGIKVLSTTDGFSDVIAWFVSPSHRRLAIVGGGVVQYTSQNLAIDNGDGTVTLGLDSVINGAVTKISFLEQVRLASDDVEVSFDGGQFMAQLSAVTVQETVAVPTRFMFDTQRAPGFSLSNPPQHSSDHLEVALDLGSATMINYTADITAIVGEVTLFFFNSGEFAALTASTGNVDGMIAMLPSQVNGLTVTRIYHEDTAFPATSRFALPSALTSTIRGSYTVIYCGAISRWVVIATGSS